PACIPGRRRSVAARQQRACARCAPLALACAGQRRSYEDAPASGCVVEPMPFRRSRTPESTLLPLSSEQQAVLDGIDAGLSSNGDLTDRTGLDSDRLQAVTRELVSLGIVVAEPVAEEVEAANDELPPGVEP